MAQAMSSNFESDLKFLTDCMYFINGHCKLDDNCLYRHCRAAAEQTNNCLKWPKTCRNVTCPYRHPATANKAAKKRKPQIVEALVNHPCQPLVALRQERFISIFWDIENVPIPKGQKPFDIVQRIRQKLVVEPGLQEADFSCYCNINTISQENQQGLHHANVRIVHIPDRKPGAADRQIMLALDRFERIVRPPATIVLISGDIDFVGKLSDLRHQAGFYVIVIHNKPAKEELKATVNAHYSWDVFTQQQLQSPVNVPNGLNSFENERQTRTTQPNRRRQSRSSSRLRRRDPSPFQSVLPNNQQQSITNNQDIKKQKCPKCINEFESVQALRQHQVAKNHLFNCPVCNETFVTIDGQTQHQKHKNHYVSDFKCNQCNHYFTKLESLNQHQQATGHLSSSIPSPDPNNIISQQRASRPLSLNDRGNNKNDQDSTLTILQGIEAIRQHFAKQRAKNN
jgi:hypothetical protein